MGKPHRTPRRTHPSLLRLGIDIGSTTVKAVLLDGDAVVIEDYRRHNAEIRIELGKLLGEVAAARPGERALVSVTGSGGLGIAELLGVPFVQEVIAETTAIQRLDPQADVIIELGGEDAKITYLKPVPEQRMNGTCAGGTGAFIDQMATLLRTDAAGLDELAADRDGSAEVTRRIQALLSRWIDGQGAEPDAAAGNGAAGPVDLGQATPDEVFEFLDRELGSN